MRIFDSHTHLQDARVLPRAGEIIARARKAGVDRILCCGTREADWDAVAELYRRFFPAIVPAFGLHPWFVRERTGGWRDKLEKIFMEIPEAAAGEIGLDSTVKEICLEDQKQVFETQMELARKHRRPVSIHCRKTWGLMVELLEKHRRGCKKAVIHSYSGPPELVPVLEKQNVSISFSGSITYERNIRVRKSLEAVSDDFLLVETDSPDIPPLGVQPEANEPAYCADIVRKMAELRGTYAEKISDITFCNAESIYTDRQEASMV